MKSLISWDAETKTQGRIAYQVSQTSPIKLKLTSKGRIAHFVYVISFYCSIAVGVRKVALSTWRTYLPPSVYQFKVFFLESEPWSSSEMSQAYTSHKGQTGSSEPSEHADLP